MRVVFLPFRPFASGVSSYFRYLVGASLSAEMEVVVLGYGSKAESPFPPEIEYIQLGASDPTWINWMGGPIMTDLAVGLRAQRALTELNGRVDLIYAVSPGSMPPRRLLPGVPRVSTVWAFRTARDSVRSGFSLFRQGWSLLAPLAQLEMDVSDYRGYSDSDLLLATTSEASRFWGGRTGVSSAYLPPPVEVGAYSFLPPVDGRLRVLIGERELDRPRNHVKRFLDVASSLPRNLSSKLAVVLVGEDHGNLTGALRRMHHAGVVTTLHRYLQRDAFFGVLQSCQLSVCLRDIRDQGGYWVLEGMARGIPAMMTDSPAFRDLGPAGMTGTYVDIGSIRDIREGLVYLLDNPSELSAMSRRSYEFVTRNHSLRSVGTVLRKTFEDLLSNRVPQPAVIA